MPITADSLAAATGKDRREVDDAVWEVVKAAKARGVLCTEEQALEALGLVAAIQAAVSSPSVEETEDGP